jgi:diguanylate cyclase (GGDEF)-like protein
MLTDYQDLANLVPRLRAFVGTIPKIEKELEQKFGILYSAAQESSDFDQWISEASEISGYTIGVIFIDIDDFKRFNTDFHETVVDRTILPEFQQLVRSACLHKAVAYRHGGEEIVVMFPNSDLEETKAFAEKLRSCVAAHHFRIDDKRTVQTTISIGVSVFPSHGETLQQVLESANRAERRAKESGKNRVAIPTL